MPSNEKNPFDDPENEIDSSTDISSDQDTQADTQKEAHMTKVQSDPMFSKPISDITTNENTHVSKGDLNYEPMKTTHKTKPTNWRNSHKTHHHLELSRESLRASKLPCLYFHERKHKAQHLADLIKANYHASATSLTADQQDVLTVFNKAQSPDGDGFPYAASHTEESVNLALGTIFYIFDRFFFFSSMALMHSRKDITIEVLDYLPNGFPGRCIHRVPFTFQEAFLGGRFGGQSKVCVKIQKSNSEDRNVRMTFYVQTLLHQMIHAFLAIYSCRYHRCNCRPKNEGF